LSTQARPVQPSITAWKTNQKYLKFEIGSDASNRSPFNF